MCAACKCKIALSLTHSCTHIWCMLMYLCKCVWERKCHLYIYAKKYTTTHTFTLSLSLSYIRVHTLFHICIHTSFTFSSFSLFVLTLIKKMLALYFLFSFNSCFHFKANVAFQREVNQKILWKLKNNHMIDPITKLDNYAASNKRMSPFFFIIYEGGSNGVLFKKSP